MTVFASCSIEVFNVTLLYDGTAGSKAWVLDPGETVLSEPRFATALIAPYSWQMVTDRLTTGIRARAVTARTADEVMASLNQELGRLALGFVSGSFVFAPAADVQILTPTILGRYPLAPLLAFTGLLALYGLIALVVFAMSTNATSSLVHVPSELRGKPQDKAVLELKLAQMRLLNPLPVVAQYFGQHQTSMPGADDPDARSVKTSALDLFPEAETREGNETRLRLGLEGGSLRPRYGVWRR
ncbi:hypothetical protein FS749_008937 [Ceratobasidium sp. UAMH 11750]|nr:hypothetical protein FS749_008937 [Ceratobasidium sp. UAMH 11750]